jgi:hypothetical protein
MSSQQQQQPELLRGGDRHTPLRRTPRTWCRQEQRELQRMLTSTTPGNELRKWVLFMLNDDEPLSAHDREMMQWAIKRYWASDRKHDLKRDRRIARYYEARKIDQRIDKLRASMTVAKAKDMVKGRHNSGKALDKWLRRNRRLPAL